MELLSDGARTAVTGDVDLARWPEQLYQLRSRIDFPTQKNIFFHGQKFAVSGVGDFTGSFHLFKGGRELKGSFVSPLAGVNDWRFPNLRGSVLWVPDRLEITNATSELYGGTARFDYRMAPFGKPTPARATWDVQYTDVDLETLSDFLETEGLRLAGRASGRNRLEWPLGKWALKTRAGRGRPSRPPPDMRPMTRELPADLVAELTALPEEAGPFNPQLSLGHLPIAGHIVYSLDPEWIRLEKSWTATEPHLCGVRGTDRIRRAVAHPVPCDEPRLAGERPRAGGDHDGVRLAHGRRADGRLRRVRRRPPRSVQASAYSGHAQGRAVQGLGRRVGHRPRRSGDREQLRLRVERHAQRRRFRDSRRRAILAGVPAPGRRRRDRRARQGDATAARRSAPCLQPRRLPDRRHGVRRVSTLRQVPDSVRLRPSEHRQGHGLRRNVRRRDLVASLRGRRRPAR